GRLVMPARLQPAADGDVVDEQRLAMIGRDNEGAGGNMAGQGLAPAERMARFHLPAQQRKMLAGAGDFGAIAADSGGERLGEDHVMPFPVVQVRRRSGAQGWL